MIGNWSDIFTSIFISKFHNHAGNFERRGCTLCNYKIFVIIIEGQKILLLFTRTNLDFRAKVGAKKTSLIGSNNVN